MAKVLLIINIMLCLFLAGCSVYNEQEPEPVVLEELKTPVFSRIESFPAKLSDQWWEYFQDPTLNKLVEEALNENFDIKIALLRREAAIFERDKVRSRYYPGVTLSPSAGASYSPTTDVIDSYSLPLSISYELDVWNKIAKSVEIQDLAIEISEEELRAVKVSISSEIAKNYLDLQTAYAIRDIVQKRLDAQRQLYELVETRVQNGFADKTAIIQLRQSIAQSEVSVTQNQQTISNLQNSLSFLLGKQLSTFEAPYVNSDIAWEKPLPLPEDIQSYSIYKRPDVSQSYLALGQQQKSIYLAHAALFPSFSISTSASFASSILKEIFDSDFFSANASAGASWTILGNGDRRTDIELAEVNYQRSYLQYKRTLFNALKELESALISNAAFTTILDQRGLVYQREMEQLAVVKARRQNGGASKIDEINQTIATLGSMMSLLEGFNDLNQIRIDLIKSLGGGFSTVTPPSLAVANNGEVAPL